MSGILYGHSRERGGGGPVKKKVQRNLKKGLTKGSRGDIMYKLSERAAESSLKIEQQDNLSSEMKRETPKILLN